MREALNRAATQLKYPQNRGIPIKRINTHPLRIGGANALALAGYNKQQQIQKMGRWRVETFLEYVCNGMAEYTAGMLHNMAKAFGFVSLEGGIYTDAMDTVIDAEYDVNVSEGELAAAA